MNRILLGAAVAVLSLALGASVQAAPKGGAGARGGSKEHDHGQRHGKGHGQRHGKGHGDRKGVHCFKGRHGHPWRSHRFDKRYGCDTYCDSGSGCWYYWCRPDDCYYPVEYCPYKTYVWDDDEDDACGCDSGDECEEDEVESCGRSCSCRGESCGRSCSCHAESCGRDSCRPHRKPFRPGHRRPGRPRPHRGGAGRPSNHGRSR